MHNRTPRMNRFLLATLVTGFVAVATPAWGQVINEVIKLLASDSAAGDRFGFSIAFDNGVVAVGAHGDDDNGTNSGSAYVFDAFTGAQIVKLLPSDGAANDAFGYSIAIDNGVVAVGAMFNTDNGTASGSAYVFNAFTGAQIAKLVPSDGAAGDRFGSSIAIDNGVVAVGAWGDDDNGTNSGSAYVFDASTGAQIVKLLADDGAADDEFGHSIAISGGIVAVGAHRDDDNGLTSGSAYLFDAFTGAQIAKLLPSDGAGNDQFGDAIALDNGVVAVGAILDDDNGSASGSAYLFDAFTGAQIVKLLPSDGAANDLFGSSIAIDNGVVAVGAIFDDDHGADSGSAYLFNASAGAQILKLLPNDGAANDTFGSSIAIDNGVVAVGVPGDDDNGGNSGSAYLFNTSALGNCVWDLDGNAVVGASDLLSLLASWGPCKGCPADFDGDGTVGASDLLILLANWGPCP